MNKSCAQFVQVLHTDPGVIGTKFNRGDADFYPNHQSEYQSGCTADGCNHSKAVFYYFASLFPQFKFIGVSCGKNIDSNSIERGRFGEFSDGKTGVFCFETTPCFPYASIIENKYVIKYSLKKSRKCCGDCKLKFSKRIQQISHEIKINS